MVLGRIIQSIGALVTVTVVRGALVFLGAYAAMLVARRLRAEARHLVWLAVLAGLVLIPLAWLVLPGVHVGPWIPRGPASDLGMAAAPALSRVEYAQLVERTVVDTSRALRPHPLPLAAILGAALAAWAAGALLLAARVVVGTVRIRAIAADAAPHAGLQSVVGRLAAQLEVRRCPRVLLSPRCSIPFTLGTRRPTIVLPFAAPSWETRMQEAVLVHELVHLRRNDIRAHSFAYAVCLILWFFPPAWLAYAALLREAETSCDQVVIDRGIRATDYAHGILELVRGSRGRMVLPAMTTALAGPPLLKERIRAVLALRPRTRPFRMRHAAAVVVVFALCVAPVLAVFASAGGSGLPADDPYFGTWVDREHEGMRGVFARVVVAPDGHIFKYARHADEAPVEEGWHTVEKAWVEAGVRWYRARTVTWQHPGGAGRIEGYCLARISADGATREVVWAQYGYPHTINSLGSCYLVTHRQE